jgi:excisionase family DNA binding protein
MDTILNRTTKDEQKIARVSFQALTEHARELKTKRGGSVRIRIQENGSDIILPKRAFSLLSDILSHMAEGRSVALIPSESQITTQQAADILQVSRPYIIKLLENRAIPFTKVGSHRRILLKDLIDYEKKQKSVRNKNLAFLAKQAQELKLGYE